MTITRNKSRRKIYKPLIPSEDQEQMALVKWLNFNHILFYHIPNGGSRNLIEGRKFKLLGVQAGVPDICIPIPAGLFHGLYIELKRRDGGVLSEAQEYWLLKLSAKGYYACMVKGAEEAIQVIKDYLNF